MTAFFNWIGECFKSIWSMLQSIFNFAVNLIEAFLNLLMNLPKFINYVISSIGFLPSFLTLFATATISIAVIYLIIGRKNGGG